LIALAVFLLVECSNEFHWSHELIQCVYLSAEKVNEVRINWHYH
jgi:hypothetical protein